MEKIALLSNVNLNFVIRKLKKNYDIYETEGYGNELSHLLNPDSAYYRFAPKITFVIMDLAELIMHRFDYEEAKKLLEEWFGDMDRCVKNGGAFYISDAYLFCPEKNAMADDLSLQILEQLYNQFLLELVNKNENVRVFPYAKLVRTIGENAAFSFKMWYLGKILHSNEFQNILSQQVEESIVREQRTAKKVLVLDLDNTLWGGLAGDYPGEDIELSDDHAGLVYKNCQRIIRMMKQSGVILAIASKNNEQDAMNVLENHPHMILKKEDFAAMQIHWEPKNISLERIAKELNLGLDSFVFWDDQETERELIRQMLPQVTVPDFPENQELLTTALTGIYDGYFRKPRVTGEDLNKTQQYAQNRQREEMKMGATDFASYLKGLQIVVRRVDAGENRERFLQLCNKTNQFNLTTVRYEVGQIQKIVEDLNKRVYLYRISDRFGEYGIVAAVIVDVTEKPIIEEFVLSCRVMGKRVEYAIMDDVEKSLISEGYQSLLATYRKTAKNAPVENLFEDMGYNVTGRDQGGNKEYEICLTGERNREYYVLVE